MPEGHVIHRLARMLNEQFAGKTVAVSSPQGVFAGPAAALDGHELTRAHAWGKHLFIDFAGGLEHVVHIHLGLIGQFRFSAAGPEPLPGVVRLEISDGDRRAHLHGPQWCRLITDAETDAAVARLGADPLQPAGADRWESIAAKVQRSRRTVASLLMDQSLFAGVGNIYRAEVLFLHHIEPHTRGCDLDAATWQNIWDELRELMAAGERTGRIDTVREDHTPAAMGRPPRKDDHGGEVYVYRREGLDCHVCQHPITAEVLEGRNLFWCPSCQPERQR